MSKEIKFRERTNQSRLSSNKFWTATKNGFKFEIKNTYNSNKYYVVAKHKTKDIVFNSLWQEIEFDTLQKAFNWCNDFDYTKFKCNGVDSVFVPNY